MDRRTFLKFASLLSLPLAGCSIPKKEKTSSGEWVNDIHSQLNPTWVREVNTTENYHEVKQQIQTAIDQKLKISICGKRHSMGGQQFATDSVLIDTTRLNRILNFDQDKGLIKVEAGITWPELIDYLVKNQSNQDFWTIAQKQTGADYLTIGGAISANIHGRGLQMKPFADDVESFEIILANGELTFCDRNNNKELFSLVIGGYGLFGFIYSVTIRLIKRQKLERIAVICNIDEVPDLFRQRISDGFTYGDFQYSINQKTEDFLNKGICSCYRPVGIETIIKEDQLELSDNDWKQLINYAHTEKDLAFKVYSEHYMKCNHQIYWSDTCQLGPYFPNYHSSLNQGYNASEIISELYVPLDKLPDFMREATKIFRSRNDEVIYGTVRLIKKDTDSFLPWAKQDFACIIFNIHTKHTPEDLIHVSETFRTLIAAAIARGGNYFLTYHRFASKKQVETCYPQLPEFLKLKLKYDPNELWASDWYRFYKAMFT